MVYYKGMSKKQKQLGISGMFKTLLLCFCVFVSSPSYATYYAGGHYNHHNHNYGYPYHRPYYNYHHRRQGHYGVHYGVHARVSETAAYVVLGILGAVLLTHIFDKDDSNHTDHYPNTYSYPTQVNTVYPELVKYQKPPVKTVYHYNTNEGWNSLANGNTSFALDVFAVQAQQNLGSGVPRIGFALAAASMNQKQRAISSMRKAVRTDANALNNINTSTIKPLIEELTKNYQLSLISDQSNKNTAFMIASLAYLSGDYDTATNFLGSEDQSASAKKLKELLKYR
jgi:hypothetical protein